MSMIPDKLTEGSVVCLYCGLRDTAITRKVSSIYLNYPRTCHKNAMCALTFMFFTYIHKLFLLLSHEIISYLHELNLFMNFFLS